MKEARDVVPHNHVVPPSHAGCNATYTAPLYLAGISNVEREEQRHFVGLK